MKISMIVAADMNGAIGKDNQIPWRLKADMQRFKRLTMGKPIIMGRKTFESIGRPLPGRTNIVISNTMDKDTDGIYVVRSAQEALLCARSNIDDEVIVIGGEQIYTEFVALTSRIYYTLVKTTVEGADSHFCGAASNVKWSADFINYELVGIDEDNEYESLFLVIDRIEDEVVDKEVS